MRYAKLMMVTVSNNNKFYYKAGNGLLNSEIIVYNENNYRIKYLIHI